MTNSMLPPFLSHVLSSDAVGVGAFGVLLAVLFVLTIAVIRLQLRVQRLAGPLFDKTVKEAQQQAEWVLVDARQKAMEYRMQAQTEADAIAKTRREEDETFREAQRAHLETLTTSAKEALDRQSSTIAQVTQSIIEALTKKGTEATERVTKEVMATEAVFTAERARLTAAFAAITAQAEKDYAVLIAGMKTRIGTEIDAEIERARAAVVAYRAAQLARVDADVVALVEDTARIALSRTLSLSEHEAIIIDALTEAKQQGLLTTIA